MIPGPTLVAVSLGSELGLSRAPLSPAQVAVTCRSLCCAVDRGHNTGGGWPFSALPEMHQNQCTGWTASDHVKAPPHHLHKQYIQGATQQALERH